MQHEKARGAAIKALLDAQIPTTDEWRSVHQSWRRGVIRKTVAGLTPDEIWKFLAGTESWLDGFSDLVAGTFDAEESLRAMTYANIGHVFREGVEPLAEEIIEEVLRSGLVEDAA